MESTGEFRCRCRLHVHVHSRAVGRARGLELAADLPIAMRKGGMFHNMLAEMARAGQQSAYTSVSTWNWTVDALRIGDDEPRMRHAIDSPQPGAKSRPRGVGSRGKNGSAFAKCNHSRVDA